MGQFQPRDTERARKLRNSATPAERELWNYLSKRQLSGRKFSRQMPIGPYFVDFLCRAENLVVELDGFSHDARQAEDQRRTRYLESKGLTVLRISNTDILENVEGALMVIESAFQAHPQPLPQAGGET